MFDFLQKKQQELPTHFDRVFPPRPSYHANDSGVDTEIPTDIRLLDISKDCNYVAYVDIHYVLYVYELISDGKSGFKPAEKPITRENLPEKHLNTKNMYLFLSVSSEGHAVISSLQIEKNGAQIQQNKDFDEESSSESSEDGDNKNDFKGCRVFRKSIQGNLDIKFNGRAVYVDDKLVLINTNEVYIHRRWNYNLLDVHRGINDLVQIKGLDPLEVSWAYTKYPSEEPEVNNKINKKSPSEVTEVQKIINMTKMIKDEILITFYSDYITKIWSLFDGTMITSIVLEKEESVMAVSNDNLHLATYNRKKGKECVHIYDTETLLPLHCIEPKGMKNGSPGSKVTTVRFCPYQHYLIIAGIKVSGDKKETFFEAWLLEKEACLVNKVVDGALTASPSPVIHTMEIKKAHGLTAISKPGFFNFKFEGYFINANASSDTSKINIEKTVIFEQKQKGTEEKTIWGKYECIDIKNKVKNDGGIYYEISGPLGENDTPLDNEGPIYIIRFGDRMVRLWKIKPIEDGKSNENLLPFKYLEDAKYKTKTSELVFIRAYKGHHSESSFRDIWKLARPKDNEQRIRFMSDEGRVMVNIEDVHSSKDSRDEFFLPLPGLEQKPTDHFNTIESLTQALYCLHSDHKHPKENTRGTKSKATKKDCTRKDSTKKDHKDDFRNSIREPDITATIISLLKNALPPDADTNFFKTRSGNRVLAMLASVDEGQDIFKRILITDNFPMTIFSILNSEEESENFLTVLIERNKCDLFELLFNEILYEYHQTGSNNLFPLMDTLLALRNKEIHGILLKCTQKLSDIDISTDKSGLLSTEYHKKFSYSSIYHFTEIQCLKKYYSHWLWKLFYKITMSKKKWNNDKEMIAIKNTEESLKRRTNMCIIPVPSYNVYNVFKYGCSVEDEEISRSSPKGDKPEKKFHTLNVIEVLIDHKWRESARVGLYGILLIHLVYYVFYSLGVSFPEEFFGYVPGTPIRNPEHLACIALMVVTGGFLFFQEMVQMKAWSLSYFKSVFNYIDLAAFILPLTTLALLVTNGTYLYDISSITILVLWLHFFLRLRVIPTIGTLSEIILRLAKKFFPVIFTLIMVVVAFTHSFVVLLRRKDDEFFQEKYDGSVVTTNDSNLLNGASMTLSDQSQQNPFKDVFLAFTTVWFFTSGNFDPVFSGDANIPMVTILAILFSFCTGLIVLNVVIALMTGAIESTKKKGNRNWYVHYIAVVAEIELFWGLFFKKNDPIYVYYWTIDNDIKERCIEFGKDIDALRSTLKFTKSRTKKCTRHY